MAMSPLLYCALPALGGYVMLSIFLLRRPRLLHAPRVPAFCPRLAAHRGGELDWGTEGGVAATEGGVAIAKQVPRWTAQRGRSKGLDVRKSAETKVGGEQGGGTGCRMRKKRPFNLG